MAFYKYVVKDAKGRSIRGKIEAPDQRGLVNLLREKNFMIISVNEFNPQAGLKMPFSTSKVPLTELVLFSRQMATMIDAGIPLMQSIEILAEQTDHKKFKEILMSVKKNVAAGASFSQALTKQGDAFSDLFINMVRAGEESGSLDEIMDRLATYLEKTAKLIAKVKSAMTYPSVVICMAIGITALIFIKVIPTFKDMYADFDATLPTPTLVLITISEFMIAWYRWVSVGLVAAVFLFRHLAKGDRFGTKIDAIKLKMPVFGLLIRKVAVSKFTRTLSTLIKSGVPILGALDITAKTSGNRVLEAAIQKVRASIKEGENISTPLGASKVFPPMVVRMIGVGEKTGELEKMLNKIAEFYEDQVDTAVQGLTSIIEPLIIGFLGVIIGGIVICMFLPIFSLAKIVG